jgi:Kef-type K+ transport system membrane component KefB
VITGMQVKLDLLADPRAVLIALGLTAVAVAGKVVAGLAAGKGNGWLVGWGMVPRGEVGLIFAAVGSRLGVVSDEEFSIIVIMVILTTLMTPPILSYLLRRQATGTQTVST